MASATTGTTQTVDLDNPAATPGVIVVTFVNNTPGGRSRGPSVAGVGDVITDGIPDIAIGAPDATVANSGLINSGAVYLLSGANIPAVTPIINLTNVGQTTLTTPNPSPGVLFLGTVTGGHGRLLAGRGGQRQRRPLRHRADRRHAHRRPRHRRRRHRLPGLRIAHPHLPGHPQRQQPVLHLARLARHSASAAVNGAIFNGLPAGSNTGFSVASAGDFNEDGFGDLMIGSPGNGIASLTGQVNLLYGQAQTAGNNGIFGTINLGAPPANVEDLTLTGPTAGSLAGFAMSSLGRMVANTNFPNERDPRSAPPDSTATRGPCT